MNSQNKFYECQNYTYLKYLYYFIFTFIMSDEFSFQEVHNQDWLKDASQFTDKHMYTHSEVSKDHFLEDMLQFSQENHASVHMQHHIHQKERTKINSKNYRDRKKGMLEHMRKQVDHLQKENQFLRAQKHCRWCQKPFAHPVLYSQSKCTSIQQEKHSSYHTKKESLQMDMEFQKPQFFTSKKQERRGKIWIAIGILMLVLGITLYGFDGDKREIKEIQIEKQQMARWKQQMQSSSEDYLQVKMRIKEQRKSMSKLDNNELRILYRNEAIQENHDPQSDKISIKKQLLYGIHAELQDIGIYL